MTNEIITAEVEIETGFGKKTIQMQVKEPSEIENCEEGKVVSLYLKNQDTYTGKFKGIDGNDVMLESLSGKNTIGLKTYWIASYLEEIDQIPVI